jgi:hypothetical protein
VWLNVLIVYSYSTADKPEIEVVANPTKVGYYKRKAQYHCSILIRKPIAPNQKICTKFN